MKKLLNISIGIPAFNEEANIQDLLRSILGQNTNNFRIKEIIIASDGSTDNTLKEIKKIHNKKIIVNAGNERHGKSFRINQILKMFKGDAVVLCDADVLIKEKDFLQKTINSSNIKRSGLITVLPKTIKANNYFQKSIQYGSDMALDLAKKWRNGDNYLMYRGCFLVLDRNFAKSVNMSSKVINNDAYLYFAAKKNKFNPTFIKNTHIYYKSPTNFLDHLKQALRFNTSRPEMKKYFDLNFDYEYRIPKKLLVEVLLKYFIKNPFLFLNYLVINFRTKFSKSKKITQTWSIAKSTKAITV